MAFDLSTFDISKFNTVLDERGLCSGVGDPNGQMCIEAAICYALGLPHGDDPGCVSAAVRSFKISLNDRQWSSPAARAEGLRKLGIAQLGSLGVVDDKEFVKRLVEKEIKVLLPKMARLVFKDKPEILAIADECEATGSRESAIKLRHAAYAADAAAYAAADAAAYATAAADAATAAAYAAAAADAARDEFLALAASLALEVLQELNSPGCSLL